MTTHQPETTQVPEGHLPPGTRPSPGRRASREAWLGNKPNATSTSSAAGTGMDHPMIRHFRHRVERFTNIADRATGRLTGIDAARGFAMIGMIAIHTLPELNEKSGRPTMTWNLFSGHSSALFAVLAGVTLALLTGGAKPYTGERLQRAKISLATRALLLMVFALMLNFLNFSAHNILLYYGLFFLLVLPFVSLSSNTLFVLAGFCAVFGPLAIQATRLVTIIDPLPNPSLTQAVSHPLGSIIALFALGTYPAFTWMTFIFIGMGIGRMQLSREKLQTKFVFYGLTLALVSAVVSQILLWQLGGIEAIRANTGFSDEKIQEILDFGGGNSEIETSIWWLAASTPHSNTTFSTLISAGIAVALIGIFLMLGKQKVVPLRMLADIGSMTLTLFTLHLIFLSFVDVTLDSELWFIVQVAAAFLIAATWKRVWKRGPLEHVVTTVSTASSKTLQPLLTASAKAKQPEVSEEFSDDAAEEIMAIDAITLPAFHDPGTTMQYKKSNRLGRNSRIRISGHYAPTSHRAKGRTRERTLK